MVYRLKWVLSTLVYLASQGRVEDRMPRDRALWRGPRARTRPRGRPSGDGSRRVSRAEGLGQAKGRRPCVRGVNAAAACRAVRARREARDPAVGGR